MRRTGQHMTLALALSSLLLFGTTRAVAVIIFFFQAEDGIRDLTVTGVQTCALPISITGTGFLPRALPTARAARGWPMRRASVAYATTSPNGMRAASASTVAWNSGTPSRSRGTRKNVRRPARYSRSSSRACSAWPRARGDAAPRPRPGRRRVTPWSLASMRNRSASGSSRGERPPSPRNRRAGAWRGAAAVGGRRVGRGAAPAQLVDTDVREHAVEPRGDRPARRVRRARCKRLHEGALHGVLGVRTVPEEPVGDGVEPAGVRLGHTAERALVHAERVYARGNSRGWKTISSPDRVGGRSPGSGGEPWRGALAGTS